MLDIVSSVVEVAFENLSAAVVHPAVKPDRHAIPGIRFWESAKLQVAFLVPLPLHQPAGVTGAGLRCGGSSGPETRPDVREAPEDALASRTRLARCQVA